MNTGALKSIDFRWISPRDSLCCFFNTMLASVTYSQFPLLSLDPETMAHTWLR
jgi:hypothetical protein